jgi:hypothetical protein
MRHLDRRSLFKLAGAGSVLAAGAALPVVGRIASEQSNLFRFRATVGLPEAPLPSYATYIVEGTLDLATGTGLVTSRVLAGHPGAPSEIGLPGLGRIVRVVSVEMRGARLDVRGIIEDRSGILPGESPQVELLIDRERGVVHAPFVGRPVELAIG